MNLYLITNEFNKSIAETSFRATVIANDANGARWLVGQRSSGFAIPEISAATVFRVGEIQAEQEGVLTVVRDNGARHLAYGQFDTSLIKDDVFYEVEIHDQTLLPFRSQDVRAEKWFAVKGRPKYLLCRTELDYTVKTGAVERNVTIHRKVPIDVNRTDQWQYVVCGEEYKTQFVDLHQASLLQIRGFVLRAAHGLPDTRSVERELQHLWSFVREEEGDGAILIEDLSFFPGQKLYWHAEEARKWAATLPQVVGLEYTVNGDNATDIPGTNCQTF